jgi:hypothetical protein
MVMRSHLIGLILPALALAGCGDAGGYPSLAKRPVEAQASDLTTEPEPQPVVIAPSDPQVARRITASLDRARASQAGFDKALAEARPVVERGAVSASGSEPWIAAQMAVSTLDKAREPVKSALSDLDNEWRQLLATPPSEDRAALQSALARIEAIDRAQDAAYRALLEAISR